jgi:hypothetical protein
MTESERLKGRAQDTRENALIPYWSSAIAAALYEIAAQLAIHNNIALHNSGVITALGLKKELGLEEKK